MLSEQKLIEMLVQAICGGIAGGLATTCSYPFTNLRLRRIAQDLKTVDIKEEKNEEMNSKREESSIIKYITEKIEIIKFTVNIIQEHGVTSLYDGMSSSIVGSVFQYAIYFCTSKFSSYVLDYFELKIGKIPKTMLINLSAAICTAIVTNPIWVLNARMAQKNKEESNYGNIEMIKLIYKESGLNGFLKGIIPSLILTLVPVMQFTSYELLKKSFQNDEGRISNKHIFFVSFISKLMTILVSYPLMSTKALYQSNSKLSSQQVWRIIINLIKDEGLLGFYKGFAPKLVGSVINNTILMFIYERLQTIIRTLLARLILGKNQSNIAFS